MFGGRDSVAALVALSLIAGAGCSSPTSTRPSGDVEISLRVTGGIAYREYSYRIDGASGDIVGEECASFCDWEPGERLARVSRAEVRGLAIRFVNAGFLEVERDDYGDECCDQLHYVLTYRDEGLEKTVQGSSEVVPMSVNELAIAVMSFVDVARGLQVPD